MNREHSENLMSVTIFIIDGGEIREGPNGETILPPAKSFRNVLFDKDYLIQMCAIMRATELEQPDPVVFRTFNEDNPDKPIFASALLTPEHYQFQIYTTGGQN